MPVTLVMAAPMLKMSPPVPPVMLAMSVKPKVPVIGLPEIPLILPALLPVTFQVWLPLPTESELLPEEPPVTVKFAKVKGPIKVKLFVLLALPSKVKDLPALPEMPEFKVIELLFKVSAKVSGVTLSTTAPV